MKQIDSQEPAGRLVAPLGRQPSGTHEAAGLSAAAGNAELPSDPCAAAALQTALQPFASNGLRHKPAAGAAGGAPEAQLTVWHQLWDATANGAATR